MTTVRVKFSGRTVDGGSPFLGHHDNIEWSDAMSEWAAQPGNKQKSKAGDDRTPSWRWHGSMYFDEEGVAIIPAENIMSCLRQGGSQVTLKKQTTFKALTQSGLVIRETGWPLLTAKGNIVRQEDLKPLRADIPFSQQVDAVRKLGFDLHVKRAVIGSSKHVRVRPMFRDWSCEGEIIILDSQITLQILQTILDYCGSYKGLGDWRPGGKTPGQWGRFKATVEQV